mgnify:CR=1 FL=1
MFWQSLVYLDDDADDDDDETICRLFDKQQPLLNDDPIEWMEADDDDEKWEKKFDAQRVKKHFLSSTNDLELWI